MQTVHRLVVEMSQAGTVPKHLASYLLQGFRQLSGFRCFSLQDCEGPLLGCKVGEQGLLQAHSSTLLYCSGSSVSRTATGRISSKHWQGCLPSRHICASVQACKQGHSYCIKTAL